MVSYNVLSRWAAQHLNSRPSQKDLSYGSCGLKTKIPWACQEHLSYTISSGSQFVAGAWRLRVQEIEGRARGRDARGEGAPAREAHENRSPPAIQLLGSSWVIYQMFW